MRVLTSGISMWCTFVAYYGALTTFLWSDASLEDYTLLDARSAVWVFSLAKTARLLERRHYRAKSFRADIVANFRNLAIPGVGIPLHLFFLTSSTACLFIAFIYPLAALITAVFMCLTTGHDLADLFREHLLQPKHWFAMWRLNSFLVAWHAMVTQDSPSTVQQYSLESKGAFLQAAEAAGIPVSPFLHDVDTLFAKHVNIEGGMGIHVLRSFTQGGDWILQRALTNSPELQQLLPPGTPLSSLRVITASKHWLRQHGPQHGRHQNPVRQAPGSKPASMGLGPGPAAVQDQDVWVMSAVLRAGRVGAMTDHNSICFPVDQQSGMLSAGRSNQHWYKLGLKHALRVGDTFGKVWSQHPDGAGYVVEGRDIAGMPAICELCTDAHRRLLPDVPLVGWDVALTAEHGPVLLELNISCNFFMGQVDLAQHAAFVTAFASVLQACDIET